jgi:hypothetical protein
MVRDMSHRWFTHSPHLTSSDKTLLMSGLSGNIIAARLYDELWRGRRHETSDGDFSMATRKVGSRKIVVDGKAYRWRIRHRATNFQADYSDGILHVTVETYDQGGSVLVLLTDRPHPSAWGIAKVLPVTPSDIAGWIRSAIGAGWTPQRPGPPTPLRVIGPAVVRLG